MKKCIVVGGFRADEVNEFFKVFRGVAYVAMYCPKNQMYEFFDGVGFSRDELKELDSLSVMMCENWSNRNKTHTDKLQSICNRLKSGGTDANVSASIANDLLSIIEALTD